MRDHYSHTRMEAKRKAVAGLSSASAKKMPQK
jgi:hypothetical protein